jgi:hypothetical protein
MKTAQLEQRETKDMGKFARAIAACVMVVGFALPNAQAATIESTTAFSPPTIFGPGLTVDIGNSFTAANSGDIFIDHYTFTTGDTGFVAGTVFTLDVLSIYNLDSFNAGLFTGAGALLDIADVIFDSGGLRMVASVVSPLAAGDYEFRVAGVVAGSDGGSYGGTLQVITAVPEPEIYAMMAVGLGIMGWIGRRRKQQAA